MSDPEIDQNQDCAEQRSLNQVAIPGLRNEVVPQPPAGDLQEGEPTRLQDAAKCIQIAAAPLRSQARTLYHSLMCSSVRASLPALVAGRTFRGR